jgi:hypothetical protein
MSETSGALILEVPYNRIPQWLQARRCLDPHWIAALSQLKTQLQAALSLSEDVLHQLHVAQDLSSVEAAELFPTILGSLKRDGRAGKSFFGTVSHLNDLC